MPANVSPEYKKAEAAYRRARDPGERLELLREMMRTIPKHKGTEHLQADIKSRIKQLSDQLAGPSKAGARTGPTTTVRPEGAAQLVLLGPPNTGKSALHAALTGSHAQVAPHPFTTQWPMPGMLPIEDISVQLVDLPPITKTHEVPWIANAVQHADGALLVIDLGHAGCVEELVVLHDVLAARKVELSAVWPNTYSMETSIDDDPFTVTLPTVAIANFADGIPGLDEELAVLRELTGYAYPVLPASAATGDGLEEIGSWLFRQLGIVRVYTKIPHQPPDLGRPYTVRAGQSVHDVAQLVHRDIADRLRYARLWGGGEFEGQQVGAEHLVSDGDVLELHV